jgi:hypothetical protein
MICRLLSIFFLTLSTQVIAGTPAYEYQRPVWAMGMGGVYTPFPREVDMPTTNAAYLHYVKSLDVEIFNINAGSPDLDTIKVFQNINLNNFADVNNYLGKTAYVGFDGRASVVSPNFGFSFYDSYYLRTYFTNPLMPSWYVNFLNDYGVTLAGAVGLGPDMSFGFAAKRINRMGGDQNLGFSTINSFISSQDSNTILDQFKNKGIGYGMDLSLLYKHENETNGPIATLVWKDLGNTTFQKTSGTDAPPHIDENLILGAGYILEGPFGFGTKFGLEYRNIRTTSMQLGEKLHTGVELSLPLVDVRCGISQGYMTYGAGIDLWFFRIDAAEYTEETGYYPGQNPEHRLEIGLTLDLSVDADFNITNSADGKKRHLKQRR